MKAEENSAAATAAGSHVHVLIFPCPAQGHVNSMLKLAELLALSDLHCTLLNTEHIHHRLLRFADIQGRLASYHTLQFKTIPDGLPADHPRHSHLIKDVINSVNLHAKPVLREMLMSDQLCSSEGSRRPRVTCIICDGILASLATDVAYEVGIPVICFRTINASCFWAYFCVPKLYESQELPIRGDRDMDRIIMGIPGMENLLRCRDLPSFCRGSETSYCDLKQVVSETQQTLRAHATIFNTFEDLEGPVLYQIRRRFPRVYTVGPLHAHLNLKTASKTTSSKQHTSYNNSLWEVDSSCMTWLDSQPSKSVLYVSFGSVMLITREQLMEIWYGLVNSKKQFLWVIRPDMMAQKDSEDQIPAELREGTKERGFMVGWAPQEEVLAHEAIGGFLTHSGWNSTLESIVAGVPMICWPYFVDQQTNSRFVSEVWRVGLDMKDVCERGTVEKMVNDLMVDRREDLVKSAEAMAALAKKSVSEGGSSYSNLENLIEYIKCLSEEEH